jgi:Fe-S-cluster-containing dehydrogenase component/DMSO reductase anchor subunit
VKVPPSFVHDLNTCVGCHACAIACVNENQLEPGRFWRQIVTHNPARAPQVPTFHLSLACNHCLDAPCLRYCPALAIARDERTGAVIIHDDLCIGCRYCSWVCPYDAPRFNDARGVMEKCTLCSHRLAEGLSPACVTLCPTGALRLGPYDETGTTDVAGFPQFDVRPAIRFLPLAGRVPQPAVVPEPTDPDDVRALAALMGESDQPPKITARSEWTLVTFTFIAILLVAWWLAALLGGPQVRVLPFLALGLGGMLLSTLHLGRKERAWRALLNWRRSWLSREVLSYAAFLGLAGMSLLLVPEAQVVRGVTALAGVACTWCIDRVYAAMALGSRAAADEGAAVTSTAFLASVLGAVPWAMVGFAVPRAFGAVQRAGLGPLVVVRLTMGLLLPCALWLWAGTAGWTWSVAVMLAAAGEALDRWQFYDALDVVTPRRKVAHALLLAS